jgi:hypothetical protein
MGGVKKEIPISSGMAGEYSHEEHVLYNGIILS